MIAGNSIVANSILVIVFATSLLFVFNVIYFLENSTIVYAEQLNSDNIISV